MSRTQLQFVYRRKCESDKSQLGLGDHESNSTVTEVNFSDFLKKPFTKGHQGLCKIESNTFGKKRFFFYKGKIEKLELKI